MGTNYYTKPKICSECKHETGEKIHLGKSSAGWQFTFQFNGGKFYKNIKQMKVWLKNKKIINEYGDDISITDFWKMVDRKQKKEYKNHAEEMMKKHPKYIQDFVIEGYSFTDSQFS